MLVFVGVAKSGSTTGEMEVVMSDRSQQNPCAEAYLIASPVGLSQLFNAVDKALSIPKGCASVELATRYGESFTFQPRECPHYKTSFAASAQVSKS